jgi:hypothetical protein
VKETEAMALKFPIFMDAQSTTPMDPRAVEAMLPYFTEKFGHPASRNHPFGWEAEGAVDAARGRIAKLIGARDPKEIVFTSGGTEAINLALKGVAEMYREKGNHIVTTAIEQRASMDVCKRLERQGLEVTYVAVGPDGVVDLEALRKAIARAPAAPLPPRPLYGNGVGTALSSLRERLTGKYPVDPAALAALLLQDDPREQAQVTIRTEAGDKRLTRIGREGNRQTFRAEMGPPAGIRQLSLMAGGETLQAVALSMGNPQLILLGPLPSAFSKVIAAPPAVRSKRIRPSAPMPVCRSHISCASGTGGVPSVRAFST